MALKCHSQFKSFWGGVILLINMNFFQEKIAKLHAKVKKMRTNKLQADQTRTINVGPCKSLQTECKITAKQRMRSNERCECIRYTKYIAALSLRQRPPNC